VIQVLSSLSSMWSPASCLPPHAAIANITELHLQYDQTV